MGVDTDWEKQGISAALRREVDCPPFQHSPCIVYLGITLPLGRLDRMVGKGGRRRRRRRRSGRREEEVRGPGKERRNHANSILVLG